MRLLRRVAASLLRITGGRIGDSLRRENAMPLHKMLREVRGEVPTPAMDAVGWDGK